MYLDPSYKTDLDIWYGTVLEENPQGFPIQNNLKDLDLSCKTAEL